MRHQINGFAEFLDQKMLQPTDKSFTDFVDEYISQQPDPKLGGKLYAILEHVRNHSNLPDDYYAREHLLGIHSPPPYLCASIDRIIYAIESESADEHKTQQIVDQLNELRNNIEELRDWGIKLRVAAIQFWHIMYDYDPEVAVKNLDKPVAQFLRDNPLPDSAPQTDRKS